MIHANAELLNFTIHVKRIHSGFCCKLFIVYDMKYAENWFRAPKRWLWLEIMFPRGPTRGFLEKYDLFSRRWIWRRA